MQAVNIFVMDLVLSLMRHSMSPMIQIYDLNIFLKSSWSKRKLYLQGFVPDGFFTESYAKNMLENIAVIF